MPENPKIEFGPCCFCGESISESEHDPCRVTVETRNEGWQVWSCHGKCFRDRLASDPIFEPAHF